MYFVECRDDFRGHRVGFVASTIEDSKKVIEQCASDWDFEFHENELIESLNTAFSKAVICGSIYTGGKSELVFSVSEIQFNERIDLE